MALYNFPNLSSTMMVLPRQTLFRCNNQDFRAQLSRNLQLIDRHTIKIGIGKSLSLSFIDYKKTSPGAGLVLIIDNKSLSSQSLLNSGKDLFLSFSRLHSIIS